LGGQGKLTQYEGKAWNTWVEELGNRAKSTRRSYLLYFNRFIERWGMGPEELYELRLKTIKSTDPRDHRHLERMVNTMIKEMRDKGFKTQTCLMLRKAMQSFFEAQELELNFRAKEKPRGSVNGSWVVMPNQIRIMYDNMVFEYKTRNRAILMGLKDSGLRISDVSALDVGDYLGAREVKVNDEIFKIFRDPAETQKMGINAYIHLGPEAVSEIDKYLNERRDMGDTLTGNSPLFMSDDGIRLSADAIKSFFMRMKKYLGDDGGKISAHSLRKFHRTMLEGAGMPESWVKKLQGKKSSVYSHPEQTGQLTHDPENKRGYVDCYHAIRIFKEPEKRIKELEEEVKRLRSRDVEIEDLRRVVQHQGELILKLMEKAKP